jgi:hypothetical protein
VRIGRTVEEGSVVDACSLHGAGEVPHLMEGDALCEADDHADAAEAGEEVDCVFAEGFEAFVCGWGGLDLGFEEGT